MTRPAQPPNLLLIPQASAGLISEHQITLPLRRLQEVCRRQCVGGEQVESKAGKGQVRRLGQHDIDRNVVR